MEEEYPIHPQFLKFCSNDDFGSAEWDADIGGLEICPPHEPKLEEPIRPSRLLWKAFWHLLEHADVWKWQPAYAPEDALPCDGHHWSLVISRDGRYINTCGYGTYPGTTENNIEAGSPYDVLRTAMDMLTSRYHDSSMGSDDKPSDVPESFEFTLWSEAFADLGIRLRWRRDTASLQWRPGIPKGTAWTSLAKPSPITWKAFWLLLDRAKVENWRTEYASVTTAHAGWSFEASINGRQIKTSGGDTYPNSEEGKDYLPGSPFDILLTALGLLAGKEILRLRDLD